MRRIQSAMALISVFVVLIVPAPSAYGQTAEARASSESQTTINMTGASWQAVLDRLFGTPDHGILDGKTTFQFKAEDLKLTSEQSAAFFSHSSTSTRDLAALIEAATALHGQLRLDGTIDGKPFDLKLAGRELKLDGITLLTNAQREALVNELRGIPGLKEMKINALVDGKETMIVVAGGKERISLVRGERPENGRREGEGREKEKAEIEHRGDVNHRVEVDRGVRVDTRIEREDRVKVRIERPELPRTGK